MDDPADIIWQPIKRSDIAWNFEKFLISPAGQVVKRYSRYFPTGDVENDIVELLNQHNLL